MATSHLPPPPSLEIHDANAAEKWKKFELAWRNYALATELSEKDEKIQVATLLTVIGEEAREVYSTFTDWARAGDKEKIEPVLTKFATYCKPQQNVPFERYRFNRRVQEPGESYDQYRTALRKLAEGCSFDTITPEELLRDRLVFGIRDAKVRRQLLRETNLTLKKTDEICRTSESTAEQMKVVEENPETKQVNAVNHPSKREPRASGERNGFRFQSAQKDNNAAAKECGNCGKAHDLKRRESCPAFRRRCAKCGKYNHFAAMCMGGAWADRNKISQTARVVDLEETEDTECDEIYCISDIAAIQLDDSQLVTLKLKSGNFLRFQPDTGAQCNVIPVHLYKKATKDVTLEHVKQYQTAIVAYGGSKIPVVGEVQIHVCRGDYQGFLDCKLVDSTEIRPLLGRKACIEMKIIKYMDNDELRKPNTGSFPVYTLDSTKGEVTNQSPLSKEDLLRKYPKVFRENVGQMEGEYRIRIDSEADPVQNAPRRVPVALRDKLKETLDDLQQQDIITAVTTPTAWINSMVVVPKANGKLRICLDPKDLNRAILREHYPLPTIEDVATRLHGAKVFTKLDVRSGFWHVVLDEKSSYLTTFQTPFGRFRWKRMPFGISSAPEVFQRRMHELIEGLQGVEVIADDFVVVGFGHTHLEAVHDHDQSLMAFLQRCEAQGVVLNTEKFTLRQKEVPFIGHIATDEGLRVDPSKVRAIIEMPAPTDKAGVQRLLGLAQYLSKFLPHLSDITKPLRELTQNDVVWLWESPQQTALDTLKKAVTTTPVLRYYNLKEEVTIQCDASQSGLGAALTQNGQPVAYASRALTPAETRYAQIEKEMLAIVFACNKFEAYIFGRDMVTIETDHKPLENIALKPLHSAPKRLQRMLMQTQKYNLRINYKKGKEMFLADTLSRAYLPEVNSCHFSQELEDIDHRILLPVSKARWQQIKHASADDPVLQQLRQTIQNGWPGTRKETPECLYPYFDFRDELTVQGDLVFKGQQLVVPAALRKELMAVTHASHIGIEGCIRRARDTLYWPRMATELKEYVSKCDVCLAHRSAPGKEPLLPHEMVARPWSKLAADLCELDGRTLLVITDYYSNFIEVARINSVTSRSVIKEMKEVFARYGIPDVLVTDNGAQFASAEFAAFAETWSFEHNTSSPRYPQSNGKAENAVQTVKRLFKKCKASGQSEYLALLDWRNTPTEGVGTSPAQRLFGRRCKTLLPVSGTLLQPRHSTEGETRAMMGMKRRQQHFYNSHTKPLQPIATGQSVRMRLPGNTTWTAGTCVGEAGPRSYKVQIGDSVYRRNRRQLIMSDEAPNKDNQQVDPDLTLTVPGEQNQATPTQVATPTPHSSEPAEAPMPQSSSALPSPRRSSRSCHPPSWMNDYVTP